MSASGFDFETGYDWAAMIATSGNQGRSWLESYQRDQGNVALWVRESLGHLRDRRIDEGLALLQRARAQWIPLRATNPAVFHALGRFYHGGIAYYFYCVEDFARSERWMRRAQWSIAQAISTAPFLLPFAALCMDVPLKLVQIARARHRWSEMKEKVTEVREITDDRQPLCTLRNGTPVYHWTVGDYLRTLSGLDETHDDAVRYLQDPQFRREVIDRMLRRLYLLPGFLISYP
ncbi:MAG TPA: hypothetical protein VIA62_11025 [Thermoanaerobaculia bacterium]|jgi:hypothetical protein|nr:hypothetical protein [Thermoanaerobaculia bacterium]